MTAEDMLILNQLTAKCDGSRIHEDSGPPYYSEKIALSAMARAREAEREACARECGPLDGGGGNWDAAMQSCADAIRARNTGKGEK